MAALFDAPDHPVTIMPDGTAGYDLTITVPNGKTLRASCKARTPSVYELTFRSFIERLQRGVAALLPPGSATDFHIHCRERPNDDAMYVQAHINAIVARYRAWRRRALVEFDLPCGRGGMKPLFAREKQFWPHAASYALVGGMELGNNEQVRFGDRLREAIVKFKRHCDEPSDGVGNIILLKIPTAMRIDEARTLSGQILATDAAHIAGVYIYRTQVTADPGGRAFYLCHELYEFDHPTSARPTRAYLPEGFTFIASPVVGRIQNVEPILTLKLDDREIQLTRTHLEHRGHRYFYADARRGGAFPCDRPPNEAVTYVLRKRGRHERHDFAPWPTQLLLV